MNTKATVQKNNVGEGGRETGQGLLWKIDRFAIHDGPGIRTSLYFKGCPLRCLWCANPEGQDPALQLALLEERCTKCGLCYDSCPRGALRVKSGLPCIDFSKCDSCGRCASSCPVNALIVYGKYVSLGQIMDIIEKDRHIYRRSGGGITCTGGEPLLQVSFLDQLLLACHEAGIHTALETCGYSDEAQFRKILANVAWLFLDLKHLCPTKHFDLTGCQNSIILRNLRVASEVAKEKGKVLVIRQVIVPNLNDGPNIAALIDFLTGLPHLDMVELLPYHGYGLYKYRALGRRYSTENLEIPSESQMQSYRNSFEDHGIKCKVGG
jgi:pyruvate formate lyase activating enzyme